MKANRIKPLPTSAMALGLAAGAGGLLWWRWATTEPALIERTRDRLADRKG